MSFWPDRARLAMSFVVNVEEGAEASIADGDKVPEAVDELGIALKKPIRNLANESNYRYGLAAGAPRILDLLAANSIRATFTAAALALERAPELARRIVADGHEVCSHGRRWVHQFAMDAAEERAFIAQAIASITATTGTRPIGWLSRYLFTENTRHLLAEAGFLYHMDDYSDDRPSWDTVETETGRRAILVLPYALDSNDMKMWTAPARGGLSRKGRGGAEPDAIASVDPSRRAPDSVARRGAANDAGLLEGGNDGPAKLHCRIGGRGGAGAEPPGGGERRLSPAPNHHHHPVPAGRGVRPGDAAVRRGARADHQASRGGGNQGGRRRRCRRAGRRLRAGGRLYAALPHHLDLRLRRGRPAVRPPAEVHPRRLHPALPPDRRPVRHHRQRPAAVEDAQRIRRGSKEAPERDHHVLVRPVRRAAHSDVAVLDRGRRP